MADRVRITDVSPRDGLQNEPGVIPTADKVKLIELLSHTGVDEVELTSFVSPKWVPQLGDAAVVLQALGEIIAEARGRFPEPEFSVLIPNEQGMKALIGAEASACRNHWVRRLVTKVSVFTSASETFSHRNTNASIAETIKRFEPVMLLAKTQQLRVRGYVSCAIACPFEGPIEPEKVVEVARTLREMGCDEVDLGDTIGAGTAQTIEALLATVRDRLGASWLERGAVTLHLHDTFGRAADCVRTALHHGIRSFDGSVAGLGGCPYASTPTKRAPGNISTETLVRTVHDAGFTTGVDLDKLNEAAAFARSIVAKARGAAT